MTKKFTRIAVVAFALCVLLALSSLAYGIDLKGRVTGLEDGTEYTYAQYDFVANAYGEFAELTADTELTSGIWGIKAGDAEPEAVFVSITDSGYINFFSNETGLQMDDIFGGKNDDYVPGKWTISTDGIYASITRYTPTQEILLNVSKDKYQVQSEVQKTVTKDDVKYNVYLIDEAEYYLKDDVYYATADDTAYEGEGEAVAVMTKTWVNCQPLMGEDNRLQESVVRYGFTNEQIVPAKDVVKFKPEGLTPKTGAMYYHTNEEGYTYTDADLKGTFTFVVKNIGSEEETRYTIDINKTTKEFVAPAEMAESNGYLVALEYAPYANCPDDIFHGHPTDTSIMCYAYINLYAGRNAIDFNEALLPAPTVYDGYGVICYDSEYDIEIAPVTISADGTGLAFGEWTDYEYDILATRDMVGLYAVRAKYGSKVSDYALAYAYGSKDGRAVLSTLDSSTNRVAVKAGGFVPGYWSNTAWKGSGNVDTHSSFGTWRLGTLGGQVTSTSTTALKNAFATLEELNAAETPDAEAIAVAETALLEAQTTVAEQYSVANYTYGYLAEDIINVNEANTLYYTWYQNNANVVFDKARVKLVAYVADREGNVTPYSTVKEHAYGSGYTISGTFNFQDFLPEEGWIVAIQVYPCSDIAPTEITAVKATGNGRMLLNVAPTYYTITDAPELPISGDKPEGLYVERGVVKGFDADNQYAWAPFSLSGYVSTDWTVLPEGTTEYTFDRLGAVAIMYVGDGYTNLGSEATNVVLGGNDDDILNLVTKNTNKQKTVTVDDTAYSVFTIDGAEYYLNGETYYAVADNSEYTGENAASAAKVMITKDVVPTVYLANNAENLNNVKFTEGMYSGIVLSNYLALNYGFSGYILGTTDTPISSTLATAIQTAVESGDETAIATARQNAADKSNAIYYSYAYKPEEIIKMSDFESLTYNAVLRQGGFKLVGSVQTKIIFKVIDENGDLVDRVVYKPATYGNTGSKTTVYASDFDAVDGHIVGIVFYPYVLTDGSYFDYNAKTNGDHNIYLFADCYKVTRTLDPADSPEGVVFEGNKITGLDADETYAYGLYTIAGKQGEWTTVTGVTEITHDLTGLIGITIAGDGIWTSESKPVLGYVAGDVTTRAEIGNVVDEKPVYKTSNQWIVGTWTGDYLSWHDQTADAYAFLDQTCGVRAQDTETLWLYQNTKEYVLEKLETDAANTTLPTGWVANNVTSNPDRLKAVVATHYAADDYADTLEANKLAHQTKIANAFAARNISYAFDETEILPIEELMSMSFVSKKRQGGFHFTDVKSKVVIHIMDENAEVTAYEWWSDSWAVPSSGIWNKITVDFKSMDNLPEEGWVVGVEFYPWADVEPSGITAVSEARIDASNIAYSFGQQHVCIGYYPADYTIAIVAPEVIYDAATGIVSGLDANKTYQYAPYSINGAGEATAVEAGSTTLQLTDGLWAITEVASGSVSQPVVVYYRSDRSTMTEIGTVVDAGTYKHYDYVGGDIWEQGKWSGLHAGVHSSFGSTYAVGTLGGHIWSAGAKALYEATDDTARAAAIAQILGDANAVNFRYAYANDEIVEAKDLLQIAFKTVRRMGSLTLGQGTAEVVFYVADETGAISQYTWSERYNAQSGSFNVSTHTIENWPTEGWVVGLQIKPWQDLDPDGLVCTPSVVDGANVYYSTMCTMTFIPTSYKIVTGDEVAETPELTLTSTNNITVNNYNTVLTYVYSADGGETWTEFKNGSFVCTKANTEYQVKTLASYPYEESEVATVTSRPVAVVGSTLVLDGRIATRVYLDVDETLVDPTSIILHATKVNSDYAGVTDMASVYRVHSNSNQNPDWMSKGYDEEKGLHYFTIYVPAKDADNVTVETELHYYVGETKHVHGSVGFNFKVTSYIATAKALAEAGDAEFVAALPLVEALETYVAYADNYFNKGTDDAYTSTATTEDIEAATRTNATLAGVEFYGTSLLLEDQVTIRHYFAVSDIDAFNAAYDVAGKYGTKGNFIYFDIADIPAQEIGKVQTLTIADAEGNTAYTVTYSVANYIVDMMNDVDANLVSLVNAMYDYYLAAVDYTK